MFDENAIVTKPNSLVTASYKLSLNGIRLFNLLFTKMEIDNYTCGNDIRIELTTSEWKECFDLKTPSTSLKAGVQDLYSASFVFEKEANTKYRMLRSYEYNDGWLGLDIDSSFLAACIKNE